MEWQVGGQRLETGDSACEAELGKVTPERRRQLVLQV